jgi:nickel-dependent lactate racemase
MKTFSLPYGNTSLTFTLPESCQIEEILPHPYTMPVNIDQTIQAALKDPLGSTAFSHFPKDASVGIAINDKTRPIPKPNPLRHLLQTLEKEGFDRKKITLFISSGTHTAMPEVEYSRLLAEDIVANYKIVVHDCDRSPMVDLGKTAYQTPILINQAYFESDLKIAVGNIEPHHFMGFSGGVKTVAIGLAGRETINTNHAMLIRDHTLSGVYHINPMRQDVEEIGRKAGVHLVLGTVLNEEKEIMRVFFGDPISVMLAAVPVVREVFGRTVPQPYDLVIASPGGAPKDINLYQSQKGLTHAARITKDDGWVVLLAACPEGSGSQSYEDYITNVDSHKSVLNEFKSGFFKVGPHKAFQIAREAIRVRIILVSEIAPQNVKQWKITPSQPEKLQDLLDWLFIQLPPNPRIAILPGATRTMAEVQNTND